MTLLRRLALPCLLLAGLSGCTEGHKTNPLPRAAETKAEERAADLNQVPIAAPRQEGKGTDKQ